MQSLCKSITKVQRMVSKKKLKSFPFESCKQVKVERARMEARDTATKGGGIHHTTGKKMHPV